MAGREFRTKRAVSSGGVLYRTQNGKIEVVVISPSGTKTWGLPKGGFQNNETPEQAATREVREETGIDGEIVAKIDDIRYWFASGRQKTRFFKTVHFYLLRYLGGSTDQHDWEVREARWVPIEEVERMLTYENERRIVHKAASLIAKVEGVDSVPS